MKSYIIFTPDIADIGGAQLYVLRRAKYLINNGYNVKIITSNSYPLLITEFNDFQILNISLDSSFKYISIFKKQKLINDIASFIGQAEIIESHTLADAIFCEVIAAKLKIKHIIYLLNEAKISLLRDKSYINFFNFKLKRGEIIGTTNQSLSIIFESQIDGKENNYVNIPFDENEFDKNENFFFPSEINPGDFVIGTISRLEKSIVIPIIESVYEFAKNKNFNIHLLVYGDSKYQRLKEQLQTRFKGTQNLRIYFPGYLHTLPNLLFHKLNVFVGIGTAVVNSIAQGCPTLVIDPRTNRCAGILGKDVFNFGYAENNQDYTLEEKLQEILTMNSTQLQQLQMNSKEFFQNNYDIKLTMPKLDALIAKSEESKEYWQFDFSYSLLEKMYLLFNNLGISLRRRTYNNFNISK